MTQLTELPPPLVVRGRRFGAELHEYYKKNPEAAARATHGVENDPDTLAASKMAECVFCIDHRIDVERLKWEVNSGPDGGSDMPLYGLRVDTKATWLEYRFLIWPIGKNDLYDGKQFDVLALVKMEAYDRKVRAERRVPTGRGHVEGWISKERFYREKIVADGSERLTPGTWYVHQKTLTPIQGVIRRIIREGKQFEFVSGVVSGADYRDGI